MKKKMKFFVLLVLFNIPIAVLSLNIVAAQNEGIHYNSLIKNIYDKYSTAGIIIAAAEHRAISQLTISYNTCRMLSLEGIPSMIVDFKEFKERLTFYVHGIVRPLVVISFTTMEEVQIFEKMATGGTMGYPVWLIFFSGKINQKMCEYCHNPYGKLIHLRFDSRVLVSCCKSNIIEEWWSPKENCTKKQKIGRWINEDRRIEWFTNRTLYSRRRSLEGRKLRIVATKGSAYIWEQDGKYAGFFGEILNELSESMNFTISKLIWADDYGYFNSATSKWNGVIGKLQRKEADIGVSPFSMTSQRLNAVDFTIPMAVGESRLYMKKLSGARVQWKAYFKAFAIDVWLVIIGLILAIPLILTLIRYRRENKFLPLVSEHYLCVWGIYCQQGLSKFPKETPLRIVYLSIFISALVSVNVYSASLVSFLTVFSSYSPFNTLEEFTRDGTYELIVLRDSALYNAYRNSKETLRMEMMSLMKPKDALPRTLVEGFRQVCNNERVAFETNEAIRKTMAHSIFCEITSIGTGSIETFGMITPRQSDYLEFINYRIKQFKYNGIFKRLENKYFKKYHQNDSNYPKVHIEGIEPILYTLAGGFIITLLIFMCEIVFKWFSKYARFFRKARNAINLFR